MTDAAAQHRPAPFSPTMLGVFPPPVMEARRWIAGREFPADRPLINLSQAAPVDAPPPSLRETMAAAVAGEGQVHLYGPVLGDPELRAEIATRWSAAYGGVIAPEDVAITAGCNQAFCAVVSTLAAAGDAVMLPVPYYFNHAMWLGMQGIETVPLSCGARMLPDLQAAEDALKAANGRIKAITLVTPNNPTGAEYPAGLLREFLKLAERHGAALIVDETYRDFHSQDGAPHDLFGDADWRDRLIHLYSFSKAFRLTGHRTGAIIADPARLAQVEKFLDTTTICAPRLGQLAALTGLRTLSNWVQGERAEILARRRGLEEAAARILPEWTLTSCGAYFAWFEHPFAESSATLAPRLVDEAGVLMLPGTMFHQAGDPAGGRALRMAFANADSAGLEAALARLAEVRA
ncbi:aminotransferase [Rhodovulum sp. DZ06]|uniref:aminotransferase n=1 Tax=Rhodovulum sp. DZ06 TaxID=3425126 RepID=UPI003D3532E9